LVTDAENIVGAATGLRKGKQIISGLAVRPQVTISKDADLKEVVGTLLQGFLELAKNDAELITIHCPEQMPGFAESGFAEKKAEGSDQVILLDLSRGADAVFKNFSQSRRSDLRKAMRENHLQISQMESEEELEQLYQIHIQWCRRKEIAPNTPEMMKTIFSEREHHRIFIAKHAGKIVAGSYFRFLRNGLFEYTANNSTPEYRHFRPNDLLVWKALEWACGEGFTLCSLGASHLFLRRFGGELVSSYRYQLDRTFFKKHEKTEAFKNFAIKTYQSLPESARHKIKRIAGRK
jgi:CelD/BcsL family acetyltransferase involved in cellulose biosynthesis